MSKLFGRKEGPGLDKKMKDLGDKVNRIEADLTMYTQVNMKQQATDARHKAGKPGPADVNVEIDIANIHSSMVKILENTRSHCEQIDDLKVKIERGNLTPVWDRAVGAAKAILAYLRGLGIGFLIYSLVLALCASGFTYMIMI